MQPCRDYTACGYGSISASCNGSFATAPWLLLFADRGGSLGKAHRGALDDNNVELTCSSTHF